MSIIDISKRSGRGKKKLTIVAGLDGDLDLKTIARAMSKAFASSVSVKEDAREGEEVLQAQGDHGTAIKAWLIDQGILTALEAKQRIRMRGF